MPDGGNGGRLMSGQDALIWLAIIGLAPFYLGAARVLWNFGGLLSAKAESIRIANFELRRADA